ncbi:early nodulin-55-2 [Abrus precatorius]|uniref:Early nodulin-55-2 n=1 Tax=Abrus precatorius TaxID=3816 RepID=A0A8B8MNH1_ABRPR|nr:early nodulin-55-2 [Abrus precatorius]
MALCLAPASPFLVFVFSMCLLFCCSQSKEYLVGGTENSWRVPLPSPDSLNKWAKTHQFRVGDSLTFKYDRRTESVHVVNETDYARCITKGQHLVFNDGNTNVLLSKLGPKHFISGTQTHCQMGLKLVVDVMPKKSKKMSNSSSPSPSPLPSLSPTPSPLSSHNQGVALGSNNGFIGVIMWVGVSLVMMCST